MLKSRGLPGSGTLASVLLSAYFLPQVHAISYTTVPSPNLDLSGLGRVAVAGDFDSISLYTYQGQNENSFSTNGSQSLLGRYPNGAFDSLAATDAYIETMCPFVMKDGSLAGLVVGGNFTSLGGVQAQGIALFDPNTTKITPLPGLSGHVSSVYCDPSSATVYVGGAFTGGNSTNAIAWTTGWTNLPFAGFNGPVTAITKAPNGNIVFAGQFDGLGNTTTPITPNGQTINIGSANITSGSSSSQSGFDNPGNIVCKTGDQDGSGNTWLLADNTPGYWDAKFGFGFNPTMMRLYNTKQDGRGTQTFRVTAFPINGIMNLTYVDSNGHNQSCSAECPLPQGNTTQQDFQFVNSVGMNEIRIDITAWYGSGGGLSGIELFQDDIYSFAISDFNEPQCDDVSKGANSTSTGPWQVTPSGQSTSDYLSANLNSGSISTSSASVVFEPDIKQSGNYSITMYTPGCIQDNTCSSRGMVNLTGTMTTEGSPLSAMLYQTNDYDKYDQIYYGHVDVGSGSFRPQVTLTPGNNQNAPLTIVAQRVRFELLSSTGGLNGLFEYNPNQATSSSNFSESAIDTAGTALNNAAMINALAVSGQNLYVAGNFTSLGGGDAGLNNIISVGTGNATALPNNGLNNAVSVLYQNGSLLYAGGNFTSSGDNSIEGLDGVALFDTGSNKWSPLGAGVNGTVSSIVPLQLNITSSDLENVVTVTGSFSEVNGFGQNASFPANGFAVWVPSHGNWLHNLGYATMMITGQLITSTNVPNSSPLYAGSVSSQVMGQTDAVGLTGSGQPTLQSLNVKISANSSASSGSMMKRAPATTATDVSGVVTGQYFMNNGMNITILGGHFTATASNGSTINNLIFLNDTKSQTVSGLPATINSNSTFLAMDVQGTSLFAGGNVTGHADNTAVNGLVVYDLAAGALAATQPPALAGPSVTVNAIASQPSSGNVYVGGSFTNAGSLGCATLCLYDTSTSQWMPPAPGLSGTITAMAWASNTQLIITGNLTAGGNKTTMVTYDAQAQKYASFNGATGLPGTITAFTAVNSQYNQFWASGIAANNGSAFLQKYDGSKWIAASELGPGTTIQDLQIVGVTSNHGSTSLIDQSQVLLITGALNLPNYGNASAAIFNGTTYQPFLLTSTSSNGQGSVSRLFVQNPGNFLSSSHHYLARGFVVLIGLAIALALVFLIVVAGILIERYRRRREGYVPVNSQLRADQQDNLSRLPPERLFGTMHEKDPAPKI